jgi:hypothetical protein
MLSDNDSTLLYSFEYLYQNGEYVQKVREIKIYYTIWRKTLDEQWDGTR